RQPGEGSPPAASWPHRRRVRRLADRRVARRATSDHGRRIGTETQLQPRGGLRIDLDAFDGCGWRGGLLASGEQNDRKQQVAHGTPKRAQGYTYGTLRSIFRGKTVRAWTKPSARAPRS